MAKSNEPDLRTSDRLVELQAELDIAFELTTERLEDQGIDRSEAIGLAGDLFHRMLDDWCEDAAGQIFDDEGYIAPIRLCTEAEIFACFGTNPHRRELLERVRNWIRLARAVGARRLLLDGSFITAKDAPGDVDAAILLPEDFHEQLLAGNSPATELMVAIFTRKPKELLFAEVEEDWWQWVEFFGRTREPTGRRKGLIEVKL